MNLPYNWTKQLMGRTAHTKLPKKKPNTKTKTTILDDQTKSLRTTLQVSLSGLTTVNYSIIPLFNYSIIFKYLINFFNFRKFTKNLSTLDFASSHH